ncbi:gephyrin-like molybdotransferase Glp [Aquabacter cavernae]|uniref:molybdopterin molybdotransferase MoeA n=1 Tax=Aquabacter cavernae TaxID=2496029 RepID=UPI000F8E65BA|nr:gephyrin-like molybdotransferase Glp [Aquabacter cavernae]
MALMPVDDALALILADAAPLPEETVDIAQAHGRVLSRDLVARRSQPVADMSAMDGYAVRAVDIANLPARLTMIGESAAGRPFSGTVLPGTAARIFTGALVPEGADTVVIQENTTRDGDVVEVVNETAPGRNIRKAGFDFMAGTALLPAGHRLDARSVMLAAAADHGTVSVRRRPSVAILQTGDELVRPGGGAASPAAVVVSNVYGVASLARDAGAEVVDLGLVGDSLEATRAAVRGAVEGGFDILVTSGGASVGEHDLMAPALKAEGVGLSVHKIALRPGKPLMFGQREAMRVLGLPGNPVSAYVCSLLFLVPLIRALQGAPAALESFDARLGAEVKANDHRRDYMRATLSHSADGTRMVAPLAVQDSGMLSALAEADCLLIREADAPTGRVGDPCKALPLLG